KNTSDIAFWSCCGSECTKGRGGTSTRPCPVSPFYTHKGHSTRGYLISTTRDDGSGRRMRTEVDDETTLGRRLPEAAGQLSVASWSRAAHGSSSATGVFGHEPGKSVGHSCGQTDRRCRPGITSTGCCNLSPDGERALRWRNRRRRRVRRSVGRCGDWNGR